MSIQKVAIIGCGSIGASWAALFLAQGITVTAFDINPAAETFLRTLVKDAIPVLSSIGLLKKTDARADDVVFTTNMADALSGVDFVQENGPELLEFKRKVFNDIAALVGPKAIIATSSSGLTCSSIQEGMNTSAGPQRCIVGHPFNPPHLIPLVEVVGGAQTHKETIERTMAFYKSVGKRAVHVKKEVEGHIANRLQAALLREILHLLEDDICSVNDIDEAMAYGPGLRLGVMGLDMLFHLGGGERGVSHFANHILGPMTTWWAPKDPVLNEELKTRWVQGTLDAVDERQYHDLTKQRDEQLVRLLNIRNDWDNYAWEAKRKEKEQSS